MRWSSPDSRRNGKISPARGGVAASSQDKYMRSPVASRRKHVALARNSPVRGGVMTSSEVKYMRSPGAPGRKHHTPLQRRNAKGRTGLANYAARARAGLRNTPDKSNSAIIGDPKSPRTLSRGYS